MRILADENVEGPTVRRLREEGHDVLWVREEWPGISDDEVLRRTWEESRLLLTQDWGFGALVVQYRRPVAGIVIVARARMGGNLDAIAARVAQQIAEMGDRLAGALTIIEAQRTRQRRLSPPEI